MKVLMINNRPPNCGIGEYTYSLNSAMKAFLNGALEMISWQGEQTENLYEILREHRNLQYIEEIWRVFSQVLFMLRIPKHYEIYHITNGSLGVLAQRLRPCIVTVHDLVTFTSPRDLTDRLIRKSHQAVKFADRVICVSQTTKNDLLHFIDMEPAKVKVIYEGVDHNRFYQRNRNECRNILNIDSHKYIILHVGSEEPRKNIPILIKAFYHLQNEIPDSILIRVGEKTSLSQELIKSLKLEDKVLYFRDVSNLELFYSAADLFCFPSYEEGFGLPPLQAMASGCPVIASDRTSIPEVVGDAGVLVDPENVQGFAQWMIDIYRNTEVRLKLTAAGIEQSKLFAWDKCADETLDVYREIAP